MSERGNKGIYFLPSLFTTAGLFFGFYAIIQAIYGNFERAAVGLLVAMIMDGLDGRVARWTNTASDFGKEYDSLVDLLAFGLAPALVMYFWSLQTIGKAGWLAAFLYTAAAALRLARFNTLTIKDSKYFYGIPCPSAAAFVVFWVWNFHVSGLDGRAAPMAWISAAATVLLAVLMVSNLRFRSFKDFNLINRIPFAILIAFAVTFVLVFFDPPRALFLMSLGYVLSGPLGWVMRWRRGTSESPAFLPDTDEDDAGDENTGGGDVAGKVVDSGETENTTADDTVNDTGKNTGGGETTGETTDETSAKTHDKTT